MKKYLKTAVFLLIFLVLSIQPALAKTVYYDTYKHWAEADIDFASNNLKIFKGYGDMTFRPDNNITRAEFVTILARTAYRQNKMNEIYTSNMSYKNMTMEHWSYTFVISMHEHLKNNNNYSLTDIFSNSNFEPDKAITRDEAVALIAAFSKISLYDNPLTFSDVNKNHKFFNEIQRLYNLEIIQGYEDNTFRGNANITRAESAALIKRVFNDMKTSDSSKYLDKLEFLPIKGEDIYSFFGNYDFNTTNTKDKKYIKAKNTLEYISFGGYIFPEHAHLYDLDAVNTMKELRDSGYYNVAGTNFYLIIFGNLTEEQKIQYADEMLTNIIARNDIADPAMMQLITLASKYDVKENLFMGVLEKWYNLTSDNNAKANILFFRYAYYLRTNNHDMLDTIVFEDLKKANSIPALLNITWKLTPGTEAVDYKNYSFGSYSFSLYRDITINRFLMSQPANYVSNTKLIQLTSMLLVENNPTINSDNFKNYENIFYKYSLNRLYVLNFLNERERAFVEGINDYNLIKTFNIYQINKQSFDDTYTGILKKVK